MIGGSMKGGQQLQCETALGKRDIAQELPGTVYT